MCVCEKRKRRKRGKEGTKRGEGELCKLLTGFATV